MRILKYSDTTLPASGKTCLFCNSSFKPGQVNQNVRILKISFIMFIIKINSSLFLFRVIENKMTIFFSKMSTRIYIQLVILFVYIHKYLI